MRKKFVDELDALAQGPLGTRLEDYVCPAKKKCKGWKESPCKHVSGKLGLPSMDSGRQASVPKVRGSKAAVKTRQETIILLGGQRTDADEVQLSGIELWEEMRWDLPGEFGRPGRKGLPPPDTWHGPLNPFDSSNYIGPPLDEILDQAPDLTEAERGAVQIFFNENETQEAVATALGFKDHKSASQLLKRGIKKLKSPEAHERLYALFQSYQDEAGEEE